MSYRSNSTGFTLIELLIIVVLLAIMASFAIPSFKQLTERNELQSAAPPRNSMRCCSTLAAKPCPRGARSASRR
ncbi:TPA: prepilin-type N-terminal cleavage/methylation domain-containing protein [Pseudomonas aeruginosa]|nr:prepilin-type N-terminal cleavage/methylation domain-containing protein [Pseudomonas aeruginosa]HBN8673423.1 prepilin-type N-terminal cleavage/methylation domain-containing protein [Pseudomonas aeruginosa]